MKNKYYLKSVKLIKLNGKLVYECKYTNGLNIEIMFFEFKENLIFNTKLEN